VLEPGVVFPFPFLEEGTDPVDLRRQAGGNAILEGVDLA
jgi:hypothetical protein